MEVGRTEVGHRVWVTQRDRKDAIVPRERNALDDVVSLQWVEEEVVVQETPRLSVLIIVHDHTVRLQVRNVHENLLAVVRIYVQRDRGETVAAVDVLLGNLIAMDRGVRLEVNRPNRGSLNNGEVICKNLENDKYFKVRMLTTLS